MIYFFTYHNAHCSTVIASIYEPLFIVKTYICVKAIIFV